MSNRDSVERRVEYSDAGFRRGASRRSVKLPGEVRHKTSSDDPFAIARDMKQKRIEDRAKR